MNDSTGSTSWRLLSTGSVPGWIALLLFAAAVAFVLWQLRLEFPGSRRAKIERWVLPALRVGIVGLLVWLLAQPVLLVESQSQSRPQTLVITEGGKSMSVAEDFGSTAAKLDALQAVGGDVPKARVSDGSKIAAVADSVRELLDTNLAPLKSAASDLSAGLPPSRGAIRALDTIASTLRQQTDAFAKTPSQPQSKGDDEASKTRAAIAASVQTLRARCDALAADAAMVSREASRQPALLDDFITRATAARDDASSLQASAIKWQAGLDRSSIGDAALKAVGAQQSKRSDLAAMAARQTSSRLEREASVSQENRTNLDDALDAIFRKRLADPITRAIVLADGAAPLSDRGAQTLAALTRLKIPVNTVLVGADGVEPRDAGLLAVDAPTIAVANQAVAVRVLVKNRLDVGVHPKLVVRDGGGGNAILTSQDVPATSDAQPYVAVAFSFTPTRAGATQFVFEIATRGPDAYAGNERFTQTIDVLPTKARVLVLGDALTNDYAAVMRVLGEMPAVDANGIVAAPEITKLKTGNKPGEFPAKLEDWKDVRLAVLLGNIPSSLPREAIDALKQAIETGGLHAFVQNAAWADAFGVPTTIAASAVSLAPDPNHWLPLYQLGATRSDSQRRWAQFPPVDGARITTATDGVSIFGGQSGSVVRVVPHGKGQILFCGIPDFSAIRASSEDSAAPRLLAGLLAMAISQPVNESQIPPDDSDFQLTPRAEPLKQIASATGGEFVTIDRLPKLWESKRSSSTRREDLERVSVARFKLWSGPWSLVALLGMASAEYLLRRRAGRVM